MISFRYILTKSSAMESSFAFKPELDKTFISGSTCIFAFASPLVICKCIGRWSPEKNTRVFQIYQKQSAYSFYFILQIYIQIPFPDIFLFYSFVNNLTFRIFAVQR